MLGATLPNERFLGRADTAAVWIAVAALAFGAAYYAGLRPAATTAGFASTGSSWGPVVTTILGSLPTFLHAGAFALLTSVVGTMSARGRAWTCASWVGIDALFEVGQHAALGPTLAVQLEYWCGAMNACTRAGRFFAQGTYDPADVVAGVLGGLAAYGLLRLVPRDRELSP